ncbi:hypothetical protein HYALB_00005720 [Hymenoscyphus albidus]|uniref:Uncharacterized protein n=1 Tax=Hymenoscyphus albidus TaxID=595503 RepID=A0A9N9LQ08_9HELO|nr:hypothetical protein HYALB_00005720 [Hymenoscyphus albidus]
MDLDRSLRWNGREFTMFNISRSLIVSRRSSASSRELPVSCRAIRGETREPSRVQNHPTPTATAMPPYCTIHIQVDLIGAISTAAAPPLQRGGLCVGTAE